MGGMDRVAQSVIRPLAAVTAAGMFVVLVMGATVTNTGSEHGCGRSWPLCHGQMIPQFAVSTFIELSHRAVVGVETMLILALSAACLVLYSRRRDVQILVVLMVAFLFVQAGLGAWAVMYPQLSAVLALHFGVSLIAFASVLLTAAFVFGTGGWNDLRSAPVVVTFRRCVWGITAYSYVVVYLGAYVRHTDSDEGCRGWPLCNGQIVPSLQGDSGRAFAHRLAALLLLAALAALVLWARRFHTLRPDLYRASQVAFGMSILQAFAGAAVVWTGMDIFSALAHAALAGLMFGSLAYLCMQVVPERVRSEERVEDARQVRQPTLAAVSGLERHSDS
jgi:cytochrome c oxidase assembly protein subunit 15